jgi:AmmeMemoRadiSam system protein B
MARPMAVAGRFYEEDHEKLAEQLHECFVGERGPGALPSKRRDTSIKGIIVPHAGYEFSGACAAWAHKEVAESAFPDLFILIGPNHFGETSGLSFEDWKTPLGIIKCDKDMVRALRDGTDLDIDDSCHAREHSLEVQMPFLQYSNKDRHNDIRVVAISIGHDIHLEKLAKDIKFVIGESEKSVCFIISTDFTHYGPAYRYLPFSLEIQKNLKVMDATAIKHIKNNDHEKLARYVDETGMTMCGIQPVLLFLRLFSKTEPHLLMYYTSGDVTGDYSNSVSYVGMVFK